MTWVKICPSMPWMVAQAALAKEHWICGKGILLKSVLTPAETELATSYTRQLEASITSAASFQTSQHRLHLVSSTTTRALVPVWKSQTQRSLNAKGCTMVQCYSGIDMVVSG